MLNRNSFFFHVFVMLMLQGAAATVPSCTRDGQTAVTETAGSDSFNLWVLLSDTPGGIRVLDLFIYRDTLTRPLESRVRLEAPLPDSIGLASRPGDRFLVSIANSPAPFNLAALRFMDAAEQIVMLYREEDPRRPLMSAVESFSGNRVKPQLSPLLCRAEILSINNLSGLTLMQPELRLLDVNASAQVLRHDGFSSIETVNSPEALAHPEMMRVPLGAGLGEGLWTAGATLFYYPFEDGGPSQTRIILSGLADGSPREWSFEVPASTRGEIRFFCLTL